MARWLALVLALGCGGGGATTSSTPPPPGGVWSDAQKCEQMCGSYCGVRESCDGTAHDVCRRELDEADGGNCAQRAGLFTDVPQAQVEACMAAVQAMSCAAFEHMVDSGEGVPQPCHGILS